MALAEELGDRRRLALVESDLAAELSIVGDLDGALDHFERVGAIHRAMGYSRSAARSAANAGAVLVLLGRAEEAERRLDFAVTDAREARAPRALGSRLVGRALARWLVGDPELARRDLAEARTLADRAFVRARIGALDAMIAAELGDLDGAEAGVAEAAPLAERGGAAALLDLARAYLARARGEPIPWDRLDEIPSGGVLTRPPDDLVLAREAQLLLERLR
jgi:tetratricopeptide (TPR) repeat protein